MNININSIDTTLVFLKGIMNIADGAIFNVTPKMTKVSCKKALSNNNRIFIGTDAITSEETFSFALTDLNKLYRVLTLCKQIEGKESDSITLNHTGSFLTYNGVSKFKLKLDREDILSNVTTPPLKTELIPEFSFNISKENHSMFLKFSDISTISGDTNKSPKCYVYVEDGKVYAEHDDKAEQYINSVSIPISEEYEGNLNNIICLPTESFQLFNIINADNIKITYTPIPCLKVDAVRKINNNRIVVTIISKLIKG